MKCKDFPAIRATISHSQKFVLFGSVLALSFLLKLATAPPALAQSDEQVEKARSEWGLTNEQLAERRNLAHSLEQDWSRGLWVVRKPLFFSSFKDVDDYLTERKIPDAAPLTPEYQKKAQALLAAGKKDRATVDTSVFTEHLRTMGISYNQDPNFKPLQPVDVVCPLYGYPLTLIQPNPFKWEFAPTKIFQLYQGDSGIARLIEAGVSTAGFDGGFRFPANTVSDGQGWGVAHWEGNVLTIEVSHVSYWYEEESGYVLEVGVPHSDKLTAVEKWWQTGPDTLQLELTLTDPEALTKPWVVTKTYDRIKGDEKYLELRDRQCH